MFRYETQGIRLTGTDLWLDAEQKVKFSYISHGHADHIKNHDRILATPATARFFAKRIGRNVATVLNFGQTLELDTMRLTLYPAGHVLGSSMILIEREGGTLLYSGDFKMQESWTAETIQIPHADVLIMESTFGNPEYRFNGNRQNLVDQLVGFVENAQQWRASAIVMAYALGKAQEAMKILGDCGYQVKVYRSAWEMAEIYQYFGVKFNNCSLWLGNGLGHDEVLIIPPHVRKNRAIQNLPRLRTVILTGWAKDDTLAKYRFGADESIALSDHADYDELLHFVQLVSPKKVYCTHGLDGFHFHLRRIGFDAEPLKTDAQLSFL